MTTSTATSPTTRQLWARSRGLLTAVLFLVLFGLAYAATAAGEQYGRLDPRSADRSGSRAVAQLLYRHGVTVDVATTTAQAVSHPGPDTTLLIVLPELLGPRQLAAVRQATEGSGGRTILIGPTPAALSVLAPAAQAVDTTDVARTLAPSCDLPAAIRAGRARLGGIVYETADKNADSCYPSEGHPSLLRLPAPNGPGDTVLLGSPDFLGNQHLDDEGNASLALQLLGQRPNLVWYLPSPADASVGSGEQRDFLDLVPAGWHWALMQLAIAAGCAALWRARRLGPVVTERLPVTVRAAEATEGRARLYRRGRARARAAEALRQATRARLAPLVGVSPAQAHDPLALCAAVTAHLGSAAPDVRSLLFGPAPTDDTTLLRLADELDALERQVRTS